MKPAEKNCALYNGVRAYFDCRQYDLQIKFDFFQAQNLNMTRCLLLYCNHLSTKRYYYSYTSLAAKESLDIFVLNKTILRTFRLFLFGFFRKPHAEYLNHKYENDILRSVALD